MSETPLLNPMNHLPVDMLSSSGNRLEGKVRAAQNAVSDKQRSELKKVAQEFEAVFIAQMLKVMRETIEESGLTEGGFGKSIYTELFDQEVALNMARHGTLGIADILYRNLSESAGSEEKPSSELPVGIPASPQNSGSQISPEGTGSADDADREISDLQLPVAAPVSSGFGMRTDPFSHRAKFHKGLDLAAPVGMQVVAAMPGKVISAGYQRGYGNSVLVEHAGGLQTRYGHLGTINVKAGDVVSSQSALGTIGNTGRSTGPHLHFEVIRMGEPVDPVLSVNSRVSARERGSVNPKLGS